MFPATSRALEPGSVSTTPIATPKTTAASRTPLPGVKVGAIERAPKPEGGSADITVLPLRMARHKVDELDRVWPTLGFASRSAFLRRAIAEYVGLRAVEA